MFEPIRARFASSCSRNGISDVATETICFGDHVHVVDVFGRPPREAARGGGGRLVRDEVALLVEGGIRLGDDVLLFLVRGQVHDLVGDVRAGSAWASAFCFFSSAAAAA